MGVYLLVSVNGLGAHMNEAAISLALPDWKNFLRLRIDPDGTLTLYPVGIARVPRRWKPTGAGPHAAAYAPDDPRATPPRSSSLLSWCRGWLPPTASRSRDEAGRARPRRLLCRLLHERRARGVPCRTLPRLCEGPPSPSPPQVAVEMPPSRGQEAGHARADASGRQTGTAAFSRARPCCCAATAPRCSARGWLDAALAALLHDTAQLLREPPPPQQWLAGQWLLELSQALGSTLGREGCRKLGFEVGREVAGGALELLIRTLLTLHCTRLQGVYERLGLLANLSLRGPVLLYTPDSERAGTLGIVHAGPPDALYALWEGCLLYAHHLCGVEGGVGRARLGSEGRSGLVQVSW